MFKVTLSLHKTVKNSHFLQEDKTLIARISAFERLASTRTHRGHRNVHVSAYRMRTRNRTDDNVHVGVALAYDHDDTQLTD